MESREQFFTALRRLIDSAESNLNHGRKRSGERKIMLAYRFLGSYGMPPDLLSDERKDEAYMNLLQKHIHLKRVFENLSKQHKTAKELIAELEREGQ